MFESWERMNRVEKVLWKFAFHLFMLLVFVWGILPAYSYYEPIVPMLDHVLTFGIVSTVVVLFATKGRWDE